MDNKVSWRDAIRLYKEAKEGVEMRDVIRIAQELNEFLRSEDGELALELLKASNCHIVFGKEKSISGRRTVFLINGDGVTLARGATESWITNPSNGTKPLLSVISAEEIVRVAINNSKMKPDEIMSWLRSSLDTVASNAPSIQ